MEGVRGTKEKGKPKAKFRFNDLLLERAASHFKVTGIIQPPEYFLDLDPEWETQVMNMHEYRESFRPKK